MSTPQEIFRYLTQGFTFDDPVIGGKGKKKRYKKKKQSLPAEIAEDIIESDADSLLDYDSNENDEQETEIHTNSNNQSKETEMEVEDVDLSAQNKRKHKNKNKYQNTSNSDIEESEISEDFKCQKIDVNGFHEVSNLNESDEIEDKKSLLQSTVKVKADGMKDEELERDFQILEGITAEKVKKKKEKKEKSEELKKKLELEEQNHFRNLHNIKAVGRGIPAALQDFASLERRYQVSEMLLQAIQKSGYTEPTPIQRQAIPCMMEDRQILACAPTGSGKTAAFLLPLIHRLGDSQKGPRALVLCPTRELAKQTHGEARRLAEGTTLRCTVVNKITEGKVKERIKLIKKSDIVISTPNRLCHLLSEGDLKTRLGRVRWLVVDEADRLFEGSADEETDFRRQMELILAATTSHERRIAMFSATHTPAIAKWCRHNMKGLINITVGHRNAATSSVAQELLFCGNEQGKLLGLRQIIQKGIKPPVLIFVQSKDRAKQLFKELLYDGIKVDTIHADKTQKQRDAVVRGFRDGAIWVLVCTELMSRGIDFAGVSLVLNYDFPPSAVSYVHRVGRAGRAGNTGKAVTFFTMDDVANLRSIASVIKQSGGDVPEYMLNLKKNTNERKKRAQRAPKRDNIYTMPENPRQKKRKHDGKHKSEGESSSKKKKKINGGAKEIAANAEDKGKVKKNKNHELPASSGVGKFVKIAKKKDGTKPQQSKVINGHAKVFEKVKKNNKFKNKKAKT